MVFSTRTSKRHVLYTRSVYVRKIQIYSFDQFFILYTSSSIHLCKQPKFYISLKKVKTCYITMIHEVFNISYSNNGSFKTTMYPMSSRYDLKFGLLRHLKYQKNLYFTSRSILITAKTKKKVLQSYESTQTYWLLIVARGTSYSAYIKFFILASENFRYVQTKIYEKY